MYGRERRRERAPLLWDRRRSQPRIRQPDILALSDLLRPAAVQYRELTHAQICHVAPFGVGDYSAYLDPINRHTKRRLLSRVLGPAGALRREQDDRESGRGSHATPSLDPARAPAHSRAIHRTNLGDWIFPNIWYTQVRAVFIICSPAPTATGETVASAP